MTQPAQAPSAEATAADGAGEHVAALQQRIAELEAEAAASDVVVQSLLEALRVADGRDEADDDEAAADEAGDASVAGARSARTRGSLEARLAAAEAALEAAQSVR